MVEVVRNGAFAARRAVALQVFLESGDRKDVRIGLENIVHKRIEDVPCLDIVPLKDISVEDRFEIVLQKLAPLGFRASHDDLGESAVPHIIIEIGYFEYDFERLLMEDRAQRAT